MSVYKGDCSDHKEFISTFERRYFQRGSYPIPLIFVAGNGGSDAQADHFVGELVGRFDGGVSKLPCMNLNMSTSVMSALSNDFGYENAMSMVLNQFGRADDVVLVLSTSGKSPNIVNVCKLANDKNMVVASITGRHKDNPVRSLSNFNISIPGNTQEVQQETLVVLHKLAHTMHLFRGKHPVEPEGF